MSARINKPVRASVRAALCGVLTALSVVFLLLVPVVPAMLYCSPVLAGMCTAIAAKEFGAGWSLGVFISVSLLSFLLVADKEAVLVYIFLAGAYPILKYVLESSRRKALSKTALRLAVKLIYINAAMLAYYFLAVYLFAIPQESFGGRVMKWAMLVFGNVIMLVYDRAIGNILLIYEHKLRKRLMSGK